MFITVSPSSAIKPATFEERLPGRIATPITSAPLAKIPVPIKALLVHFFIATVD